VVEPSADSLNEASLYSPRSDALEREIVAAEDRLYARTRRSSVVFTEDELLDLFVANLGERIGLKKDNVVIIDGPKRSGKTTLGLRPGNSVLELLERLGIIRPRPRYLGQPMNLERDVVYRLDKWIARVRSGVRGDVILSDEGIFSAQSGSGKPPEVMVLERVLSVCGRKNMTLIVLAPSIEQLAKAVSRSTLANYWVNVEDRGRAAPHEFVPRRHYKPSNLSQFNRFKPPRDYLYWDAFDDSDPYWIRYEELADAGKGQGELDAQKEAELLHRKATGGS